jgi:hypothetical protein
MEILATFEFDEIFEGNPWGTADQAREHKELIKRVLTEEFKIEEFYMDFSSDPRGRPCPSKEICFLSRELMIRLLRAAPWALSDFVAGLEHKMGLTGRNVRAEVNIPWTGKQRRIRVEVRNKWIVLEMV